MSTNLIIGIVAAVAVVGGGTYVAMNPEIMANITGGFGNQEGDPASVGNTFAGILALGQDLECTFSHDDNAGNRSSGTVYIADGGARLAGEFNVEASAGGPMQAFMVRTGGYNYMWGSGFPQGVKSQVVNEAELMAQGDGGIDPNTEFACQAWNVDNSVFVVPTSIQFMEVNVNAGAGASGTWPTGTDIPDGVFDTDMDASVNTGGSVNTGAGGASGSAGAGVSGSAGGSTSGTAEQCAACNELPPGAKEQCLANLSC